MVAGKLFEILMQKILLSVGFSNIRSDEIYIFDGAPGQMIQGLGQAHNADVLMTPPIQIPFYNPSRILIECKDYSNKVGIDKIRSALGLREDINSFEIIDEAVLQARRNHRRTDLVYKYTRYYYQVAVASFNGFTLPAQEFAVTHRIPLITFSELPFWRDVITLIKEIDSENRRANYKNTSIERVLKNDPRYNDFIGLVDKISKRMALAITLDGQMLFLYKDNDEKLEFENEDYRLYWNDDTTYWKFECGIETFLFQLPDKIKEFWLSNSKNELETKISAINCKADFLSSLVVYYTEYSLPRIKMINIDKDALEQAYKEIIKTKKI